MEPKTIILVVYIYGWIVTCFALIEDFTAAKVFAAFFVAVLWPLLIPGAMLRKILK